MITAQLATIPGREQLLVNTVQSLRGQVDKVRVALNNYETTPSWLTMIDNVEPFLRNNEKGDAEKFYNLPRGYILTCDDDLIYPDDYVSYMLQKLRQYDYKAVVSAHGRGYLRKPVQSYYRSRDYAYRCLGEVKKDCRIPIGTVGSGVMCYHTDYFNIEYNKIKYKNMADIWVAKFAQEQGVPLIVVAHSEGWLKYQEPPYTIWDLENMNDFTQTDLFNSF